MAILRIDNIERNEGCFTQQYLFEYKRHGTTDWIAGPTFPYAVVKDETFPVTLPLPDSWSSGSVDYRIVTISGTTRVTGATKQANITSP